MFKFSNEKYNPMQKSLFLAFCLLLTTSLLAQSKLDKIENVGNRRSETYFFTETTYDSVRFTIQGKTIQF
jgi:hypothetical protein